MGIKKIKEGDLKNLQIYKLSFSSGFHVDGYGNESYSRSGDFIHSDTLSAAVLSAWALLRPDKAGDLAKKPPYLLSSAFPFFGGAFFLPLPQGRSLIEERKEANGAENSLALRKKLKKIRFLPSNLWAELLSDPEVFLIPGGEGGSSSGSSRFKLSKGSNGRYKVSSSFLIPAKFSASEEGPGLLKREDQRVAVSRLGDQAEGGQLFLFSRSCFPSRMQKNRESKNLQKEAKSGGKADSEAGLWFFAQFSDQKSRLGFEAALKLLGDTGIGSDKNAGSGQFKVSKESLPSFPFFAEESRPFAPLALKKAAGADKKGNFCLLSLFCPSAAEQKNTGWLKGASYDLKRRGGWIHNSPFRRKSLFMFAEGSCFSLPGARALEGAAKDVTPEISALRHKVFRDGRGFFVRF